MTHISYNNNQSKISHLHSDLQNSLKYELMMGFRFHVVIRGCTDCIMYISEDFSTQAIILLRL